MENKKISSTIFLLPTRFKYLGVLLFFFGAAVAAIRFSLGIKPDFLKLKVFAFYSKYLETKYFSFIDNNYIEEIAGLLLLSGLIMMAFSEEKNEEDGLLLIRIKSLVLSVYINSFLLILSLIFIFGIGFVYILVINMFSMLLIYIVVFRITLYKVRRINKIVS